MPNKLKKAGLELIKGNLGNAFLSLTKSTSTSLPVYPARYKRGNFFFGINGQDKAFTWTDNQKSALSAYQQCPVVSTIINRKGLAKINGRMKIVNSDGKESQTQFAKELRKLLAKPNPLQNGAMFRAQADVYKQIYGWCPILIIIPAGFEEEPSYWKLWNVPPWMLSIQDTQDFFFTSYNNKFQSVVLTFGGKSIDLNQDKIFFLKEIQISTAGQGSGYGDHIESIHLPDSRLRAIEQPISNIIDAYNSRGALIRERGPMWLLTNDTADSPESGVFPLDVERIKELHQDFAQYGIMKGLRKAIITSAKLKLQTVGFDVAQLKLHEEEVQSAKAICDQLNYPPNLLGLLDSKYDNMHIAERGLYQNAIIPDSISEAEQWTSLFKLEDKNLRIEFDYSHLQVFQEDKVNEGRARLYLNQAFEIAWRNDQVTWNEWRVASGMEPADGMDKYLSDLIKEGRIDPKNLQPTAPSQNIEVQTQNSSGK